VRDTSPRTHPSMLAEISGRKRAGGYVPHFLARGTEYQLRRCGQGKTDYMLEVTRFRIRMQEFLKSIQHRETGHFFTSLTNWLYLQENSVTQVSSDKQVSIKFWKTTGAGIRPTMHWNSGSGPYSPWLRFALSECSCYYCCY